jgi:hypothetical protein
MRRTLLLAATLILLLLLPAAAVADIVASTSDAAPLPHTQLLPSAQLYALIVGALVPLATYMLNHRARWASEPVKALVLVVVSAIAGAGAQLIDAGTLAFDTNTLQVVVTAVVGALLAHAGLWTRSGVSARLGGGTNR